MVKSSRRKAIRAINTLVPKKEAGLYNGSWLPVTIRPAQTLGCPDIPPVAFRYFNLANCSARSFLLPIKSCFWKVQTCSVLASKDVVHWDIRILEAPVLAKLLPMLIPHIETRTTCRQP